MYRLVMDDSRNSKPSNDDEKEDSCFTKDPGKTNQR